MKIKNTNANAKQYNGNEILAVDRMQIIVKKKKSNVR